MELGFPQRFIQWVMACLTSVSYVINVNGVLTEPFEVKKGIRQGDPNSPYLFVLCMEYLSRCLMELKYNKLFQYHPRCKKVGLTHLCFADDLLLFTKGNASSVQQVKIILDKFASASRLKANPAKSCVYFGGMQHEVKMDILRSTGMTEGTLPFRYLGVPLSSKKITLV